METIQQRLRVPPLGFQFRRARLRFRIHGFQFRPLLEHLRAPTRALLPLGYQPLALGGSLCARPLQLPDDPFRLPLVVIRGQGCLLQFLEPPPCCFELLGLPAHRFFGTLKALFETAQILLGRFELRGQVPHLLLQH